MTCRLILVGLALAFPGCAVAGVVVGNLFLAGSGGAGIYQRYEQTGALHGLRQELADLKILLTPQLRTVSDRLREEMR